MRVSIFIRLSLAAIVLLSSFMAAPVQAQIPVADSNSAKNSIKDFMQRVKESKTVTDTIAFANKTSAAVGDAKKSVSEYVVKNKEKIQKKVEKVEKYKKQAEEYKKDYDEYKKWTDESIAQAKEMKEQAEAGLEQAKELKDSAGGMVDAAKGMAQDKIGGVTGQVDGLASQAGIDTNVSGSNDSGNSSDVPSQESPAATPSSAPSTGGNSAPSYSAPTPQAPVSSRAAFSQGGSLGGGAANYSAPAASSATEQVMPEAIPAEVEAAPLATEATTPEAEMMPVETEANSLPEAAEAVAAQPMKGVADAGKIEGMPKAAQRTKDVTDAGKIKDAQKAAKSMKKMERKSKASAMDNSVQPIKKVQSPNKLNRAPARRSFKNVDQLSALLPAEIYARADISGSTPLAFAFGLQLPSDGGTDVNGNVIVVKTISMTCGMMSSTKAKEEGVMDDCLVKQMNDKTTGAQIYEGQDMTSTYIQGKKEFVAAYMAEAYKAKNDTEEFTDKILFPIDTADSTSATDDYSNMVEMNKAVATTINGLLKVYSSKLALDAYTNYGNYKFLTPQES